MPNGSHIPAEQKFDVLVLGAGLAGMRAAIAALETMPGASVGVVSAVCGPSGSSFSNFHDRLGMQYASDDAERHQFCRDAEDLAAPGSVDSDLVETMAEDSRLSFQWLRDLGVHFIGGEDGLPTRFPGCFAPSRRAVLFTDLGHVFRSFKARLDDLGATFLCGCLVRDLITDDSGDHRRVTGALLQCREDAAKLMAVQARSVIMALGGPAPLFALNQAGASNPGFALGLLARAGATTVNERYLQIMWGRMPSRKYWPIWSLATPGHFVVAPDGQKLELPDELHTLAQQRSTHCPISNGLADAALDRFVLDHLDEDGRVTIHSPQDGPFAVSPMAHAGNGGALIDCNGRTSVAGLYACGECASGMHGANRMGGGMVLATQVFGRRAGIAAAQAIKYTPFLTDKMFTRLVNDSRRHALVDVSSRFRHMKWLSRKLQRALVNEPSCHVRGLGEALEERLSQTLDWQARLALETARAMVREHQNDHLMN